MFDSQFAILFKAVERLRRQLEGADEAFRSYLAEELSSLRNLNNQCIDYWMSLEEQIQDLAERYSLKLTDTVPLSTDVPPSKSGQEESTLRTGLTDYSVFSLGPTSPRSENPQPQKDPLQGYSFSAVSSTMKNSSENEPTTKFAEWMNLAFADHDVAEAPLRKGIGYFDLLMYDQAADFLNEYLSQAEHPVARLFLGATYLARRENHRAQRELLRVREITRDPLLICAANELEAHIAASRGDYEEAIQLLMVVANVMPEYPDVWYNLGLCFALSGHHAKSVQSLEHSLRLQPGNEDTSRLLALVLLKVGDIKKASKTVNQALQRHPHSSDLLLLKSELAFREQRFDAGAEACRQVLHGDPKHPDARSALAKGLLQGGQVDKAIGVLKKQLAIQPNRSSTLVQLGVAYLLSGRYERAEQCILSSMVSYSDKGFLWLVLGRISAVRGDTGQAYYRYIRSIRDARKPVKRLALYLYGLTLYEDGQYAEAEKYLKAAHLLGEPNAAITVLLAKTAEAQGHIKEAEILLESAFDHAPHHS